MSPGAFLRNERTRSLAIQLLLVGLVAYLIYAAGANVLDNMRGAGREPGFGFLQDTSGFDVNQKLIPYGATSTYGRAFLVGLLNTLLVAAIGIVLATVLGFAIGVARLSGNWLVAKLAGAYVELIRNVPLLLQLLFWYNAVLAPLPAANASQPLGLGVFINNRGLYLPRPLPGEGAWLVGLALLAGIAGAGLLAVRAARVQARTGRRPRTWPWALALVLGLPALAWIGLAAGGAAPVSFEIAQQERYNLFGGVRVYPEFIALVLGLVTYTAGFIAEIVRAGIVAVSRGQGEAAASLGLRPVQTMRLVVIPQALRIIIPPLTGQYLNLTKNSSLAVAIGYPDLVQIFMGTVLNQTGRAVEVVAITMAVYLAISLATAAIMNAFNSRVVLVER